jgi:hypothetical protein
MPRLVIATNTNRTEYKPIFAHRGCLEREINNTLVERINCSVQTGEEARDPNPPPLVTLEQTRQTPLFLCASGRSLVDDLISR